MKSRLVNSMFVKRFGVLTVCLSLTMATALSAAKKPSKIDAVEETASGAKAAEAKTDLKRTVKKRKQRRGRPITKLKFDPKADKLDLFKGMKEGQFDVRLIANDSKSGNILIENTTDKPLTVEMPKSFVGIHVLKQYGGGGLGGGGLGGGGLGGGGQGGGQALGGGQGGGLGGGGLGGGGGGGYGGGGGGGFFSIPPEKVVKVPFHSVCLNHGKPEPSPGKIYRMVKVEDYTKDKNLQMMINLVAANKIDPEIAQAATWHLSDKMSWRELAAKQKKHLGRGPTPYFPMAKLIRARELVGLAIAKVNEKENNEKPSQRSNRENASRRRIR